MSTQRIYRTGLCATGLDELERSLRQWPSLRGAGFGFEFRPHAIDGERKAAAKTLPRRFQSSLRPPEVHILAPSSSRADAAALLLYAAHALIDASIPAGALVGWDPYRAIPTGRQEFLVWERINHYTTRPHSLRLQISGVADIVGLAARLSRRSKWTHVAFFYLASVYLVSVDPIDLHPKERDSNYYRTPFLMHRVWEAQSLFAAFQVLETLDLTVKGASAHRPSVVQNKWDSQLRADLEQRLLDIGVAPDETFSWAVRGPANGLEKKLNERTTASLQAGLLTTYVIKAYPMWMRSIGLNGYEVTCLLIDRGGISPN